MKITPGNDGSITHRNVVPGKGSASSAGHAASGGASMARGTDRPAAGMGGQRTISEALTIAHTARSLISRALTISSQLQSIAQQAITTGSVDRAGVSRTISEINVSMSQATGQPVFAVIPPAVNSGTAEPARVEIPTAREELNLLGAIASTIDAGGSIDDGAIGEVRSSLQRKAGAVGDILSSVERSIQGLPGGSDIEGTAGAERAARNLAASISSSPAMALSAQGNIRQENVLSHLS